MYLCMDACVHACIYIIYIYTCVYVYVYVCVYVYMCMHMYMYNIISYTYIYIYQYIYIQRSNLHCLDPETFLYARITSNNRRCEQHSKRYQHDQEMDLQTEDMPMLTAQMHWIKVIRSGYQMILDVWVEIGQIERKVQNKQVWQERIDRQDKKT